MSSPITAKITTVQAKVKRPPEDDVRREQWDRTARFIWRVFIISIAILISLLFRTWEVPEMAALVAERVPDFVDETVEFFAKMG
jgi:hypothetical protein